LTWVLPYGGGDEEGLQVRLFVFYWRKFSQKEQMKIKNLTIK
jgi:hypothetical protein